MQLQISKPGSDTQEYTFTRGPIYLGRHQDCHVRLASHEVSRQHAVIFITLEGHAVLQDLNSANGTFLNGHRIKEQKLSNGDQFRIGDFHVQVTVDEEALASEELILDDTSVESERTTQIITREHTSQQGPDIILPITRATDFARAARALCVANGPHQLLQTLLVVLLQQFHASRAWCSLRADISGNAGYAVGTTEKGETVTWQNLEMREEIQQAVEGGKFCLIPSTAEDDRVRIPCSAMIAPLMQWHKRLGVLYLDRHADWKPFTMSDLDYLMILSIQAGATLGGSHNLAAKEEASESQS